MITRAIIEAQLSLYKKGKEQATVALNKASFEVERCKASINVFDGAIECCNQFLSLTEQLEKAEQDKKTEVK